MIRSKIISTFAALALVGLSAAGVSAFAEDGAKKSPAKKGLLIMYNGQKFQGDFVELKKAVLEQGAQASHLSYLGDGTIGEKANIGAGTIFCNYDGFNKARTEVGAGAFVGSNSSLVAPVVIGDGAIIAARALVNQDVPPYAMVAGTPARVVRMRFGDDDIARLQALAWWDWPDDKVQALLPLIQQGEVALLEQAAARWQGACQGL